MKRRGLLLVAPRIVGKTCISQNFYKSSIFYAQYVTRPNEKLAPKPWLRTKTSTLTREDRLKQIAAAEKKTKTTLGADDKYFLAELLRLTEPGQIAKDIEFTRAEAEKAALRAEKIFDETGRPPIEIRQTIEDRLELGKVTGVPFGEKPKDLDKYYAWVKKQEDIRKEMHAAAREGREYTGPQPNYERAIWEVTPDDEKALSAAEKASSPVDTTTTTTTTPPPIGSSYGYLKFVRTMNIALASTVSAAVVIPYLPLTELTTPVVDYALVGLIPYHMHYYMQHVIHDYFPHGIQMLSRLAMFLLSIFVFFGLLEIKRQRGICQSVKDLWNPQGDAQLKH